MNTNGEDYLFFIAEDEEAMSDYCRSKSEAIINFKNLYKHKPDRVIGIFKVNDKKNMEGRIVWEDLAFLQ